MLIVTVWGLPSDLSESNRRALKTQLATVMQDFPPLRKMDASDLKILLPKDLSPGYIGADIFIEYGGALELIADPLHDHWGELLGIRLARIVKDMFPDSTIYMRENISPVTRVKL